MSLPLPSWALHFCHPEPNNTPMSSWACRRISPPHEIPRYRSAWQRMCHSWLNTAFIIIPAEQHVPCHSGWTKRPLSFRLNKTSFVILSLPKDLSPHKKIEPFTKQENFLLGIASTFANLIIGMDASHSNAQVTTMEGGTAACSGIHATLKFSIFSNPNRYTKNIYSELCFAKEMFGFLCLSRLIGLLLGRFCLKCSIIERRLL